MPRGPVRKTAEMQLHLGNPSKRNRKALEAAAAVDSVPPGAAALAPTIDIPDPPLDLCEAGLGHWRRLYTQMTDRGLLRETDHYALARYCDDLVLYHALRYTLRDGRAKNGIRTTYKTRTTTGADKVAHRPEYGQLMQLRPGLVTLERELGLTPSARGTVTGKLAEAKDPVRPPLGARPMQPHPADPSKPQPPPAPASPVGILTGTKH